MDVDNFLQTVFSSPVLDFIKSFTLSANKKPDASSLCPVTKASSYLSHVSASLKNTTSKPSEDRLVICTSFTDQIKCSNELEPTSTLSLKATKFETLPSLTCFAVIDGHGGSGCANFITECLVKAIAQDWCFTNELEDISKALPDTMERVLMSIEKSWMTRAQETLDNSGACIVVALHLDGWVCVTNIGDAGAAMFLDGKVTQVGNQHSALNRSEAARITKAGGKIHKGYIENQLQPSRTIGDRQMKTKFPGLVIPNPESKILFIPHDVSVASLILASDGLWDVGWGKCSYFIQEHLKFWQICSGSTGGQYKRSGFVDPALTICKYARSSGSSDDTTVCLAFFR